MKEIEVINMSAFRKFPVNFVPSVNNCKVGGGALS